MQNEPQLSAELRSIAEYLGCNEGEFISEVSKLLATALGEQRADFLRKVEELRKPEKDHLLDYDDIPTCYACDFDQAIDEVLAILEGKK